MKKTNYYILFDNHEQAVRLHRELKGAGWKVVIAPTPREASICCGVSVMVQEQDIEEVQAYLREHQSVYKELHRVEQEFNSRRDLYI